MHQATQELGHVRRVARWLLLTQHLARFACVATVLAVFLGTADWALRLPGWLRLLVGLCVAGSGAVWLGRRLRAAIGFRPRLSLLALRAERLHPQLAGWLASGVELADPSHFNSEAAGSLIQESVTQAQRKLSGLSLRQMIDSRQTVRVSLLAGLALLGLAVTVAAAPGACRTAALRWAWPMGDTQWPRWTSVRSLVAETVWPADTPLHLRARVERGYHRGMRTWARYRLVGPTGLRGDWQTLLMNEQGGFIDDPSASGPAPGTFERLVDLPEVKSPGLSGPLPGVEFCFVAGDDQSEVQRIQVEERPAARSVTATITPPGYSRGLVDPQTVELHLQQGQIAGAAGLAGSTVDLRVVFNQPIRVPSHGWDGFFPGLVGSSSAAVVGEAAAEPGWAGAVVKSFELSQTVQTAIRLVNQHGLTSSSERLYRFEAIADGPPAVSLVKPDYDESVLATARVPLEAVARDDVGVEELAIELTVEQTAGQTEDGPAPAGGADRVVQAGGRQPQVSVAHSLELGRMQLRPGDQVVLTGVARDGFEDQGQRRSPVRSTPRKLRIIDPATLMDQVRTDLAGVRQQAVLLEAQQRTLLDSDSPNTAGSQQQLTAHLSSQAQQIAALSARMERNQLDVDEAAGLYQMVQQSSGLTGNAVQASRSGYEALGRAQRDPDRAAEHRAQASAHQQGVIDNLAKLIDLLDQGKDALALQAKLQQIRAIQEAIAADARQLMPRTLGRPIEQLNKPDQQAVSDLADRQEAVAKQIDPLQQRMQAAADALARQGRSADDQAAAATLTEAGSIARRQGLAETLRQAAGKTRGNRLSDAGQDHQQALDVIDQMLDQWDRMQERRQAILHRRLVELVQSIRKLLEQQQGQRDRLEQAVDLAGLDRSQGDVRRRTMVTAQEARTSASAADVAGRLDRAVEDQTAAVVALGDLRREPAAKAQDLAIENLKKALELAQQMRQQAQAGEASKRRQALRQEYQKLAQQQEEIRELTGPLTGLEVPTRMERAKLVRLGHREADLKVSAKRLLPQVEQTLVFTHLHRRIDQAATQIASELRRLTANEETLAMQSGVAAMLMQMADALAQDQADPTYSSQPGSGGGGGGGSPPPVVPPLAELKLLRGLQENINNDTKTWDQRRAREDNDDRTATALTGLSDQQRQLSGLGQRLIEQMRQSQQTPPPPSGAGE